VERHALFAEQRLDVGGADVSLQAAHPGPGAVALAELLEVRRAALDEQAVPALLQGQPGTVTLLTRFDAELDEVFLRRTDAAQDRCEEAVLAVLRIDAALERAQVAGLQPGGPLRLAPGVLGGGGEPLRRARHLRVHRPQPALEGMEPMTEPAAPHQPEGAA